MVKRAYTPRARVVSIVLNESHGHTSYSVHIGERYLDRLNWDEMLGTVARLTHSKLQGESSYGGPLTPEEYQAREERLAARRAARAAEAGSPK